MLSDTLVLGIQAVLFMSNAVFDPFPGVIPHIHKSLIGKKGQQKTV